MSSSSACGGMAVAGSGNDTQPQASSGAMPPSISHSMLVDDAKKHVCEEARILLQSLRRGPPAVARGDLAANLSQLRHRLVVVVEQRGNGENDAVGGAVQQEGEGSSARTTTTTATPSVSSGPAVGGGDEGALVAAAAGGGGATEDVFDHHQHMIDVSYPFLQVVVDPRAAGPQTLVALRCLLRMLERRTLDKFRVQLEPLLRGVLACKFEQTDALGDEAVEMAIADVLSQIIVMDCCNGNSTNNKNKTRISNDVVMDAFNTVFVTRNTYVHSPALCYHFEDVLSNVVAAICKETEEEDSGSNNGSDDDDDDDSRKVRILEFLINQLLHTPLVANDQSQEFYVDESVREAQQAHDATRILCLRLTRTALSNVSDEDLLSNDQLLNLIEDDLCLGLLMTGQAIWAYHDHGSGSGGDGDVGKSTAATSSSGTTSGGSTDGNGNHHHSSSYKPASSSGHRGIVSLEVLSEICATLSQLWNRRSLRPRLVSQMEAIFTGFYTRALVLLRKRRHPHNSKAFNANLLFDAEVEIILESLVDLLCLHSHNSQQSQSSTTDGFDGGALVTLFAAYDCHLERSDVAAGLVLELCRCCGAYVDKEGDAMIFSSSRSSNSLASFLASPVPSPPNSGVDTPSIQQLYQIQQQQLSDAVAAGAPPSPVQKQLQQQQQEMQQSEKSELPPTPPPASTPSKDDRLDTTEYDMSHIDSQAFYRHVPAHLKELCAQAVMGAMRCLFADDRASDETLQQRHERKRSIMLRQVSGTGIAGTPGDRMAALTAGGNVGAGSTSSSQHYLRDVKSKKRLLRKAARIFNQKASRGIEFLIDSGLMSHPVKPSAVATFLRSAIVMGLDKKAVGQYLGEAGKSPQAGKSPPDWERDWFHREVLQTYCSLFKFENQSVLDGLRMFLAAFRLPGEAQQIDRILQAFADRCAQVCEESPGGRLGLFSDDPKRASDAAYLLSFSIIMLNTDRHNTNIREERKMSCNDFVKNNIDYGRDITEKGKELPREYLEGIYHSINEEEIRTEGEGAEGAMTVERWKDVLRGSNKVASSDGEVEEQLAPSVHDAEDLTELVLEHVWKPIVSAIGALWGISPADRDRDWEVEDGDSLDIRAQSGMLGAQGARLGMDMALEMLRGVRQLGRIDIFRKIFCWVCEYTNLIGDYKSDAAGRARSLTNSVESQSAIIVALNTAVEAGEELDEDAWKRVWLIVFELRDLKLIPLRSAGFGRTMLAESDPDLLTESARREWIICQIKGDMNFDLSSASKSKQPKPSLLGAFGRALFGGVGDMSEGDSQYDDYEGGYAPPEKTAHGKEDLVVWDDCGHSDDEGDDMKDLEQALTNEPAYTLSPGEKFEGQLIQESIDLSNQVDMPVTGLERVDETRKYRDSPRARVRERLRSNVNMKALISDTRFINDSGVVCVVRSIAELISCARRRPNSVSAAAPSIPARRSLDRVASSDSLTYSPPPTNTNLQVYLPISPASEALAEVLLCEIALKNKDRLKLLWEKVLQDHYLGQLTSILLINKPIDSSGGEGSRPKRMPADPGLEKRVTGLIRISLCAVTREEVANDVLSSWKYVLPVNEAQQSVSPLRVLDRHFGEGLWRIASEVDSLSRLNADGWEGVGALLYWCASRGGYLKPVRYNEIEGRMAFSEDDPALQAYRAIHLMLITDDLVGKVPYSVVDSLKVLALVGERRQYAQLSIAALDLLHTFLEKRVAAMKRIGEAPGEAPDEDDIFWTACWKKVVQAIAGVAEQSCDSNVRQHALSMLTDLFLDKSAASVPGRHLSSVLSDVCIPLAGRCIVKLRTGQARLHSSDELMIEFELCIGLIFKPLRHYLQAAQGGAGGSGVEGSTPLKVTAGGVADDDGLCSIWKSVLNVLESLLQDEPAAESEQAPAHPEMMQQPLPGGLKSTMDNLANEHLRNAIVVLISAGVIQPGGEDVGRGGDITKLTIESVSRMGISEKALEEWKQQAAGSSG